MFNSNQRRGINWIFVFVYLVVGLYFLNYPFGFFSVPEFVSNFDKWIIFIAGVFMVIGAFTSIRFGRDYRK